MNVQNTEMVIMDPTMQVAWKLAEDTYGTPVEPPWLMEIATCVQVVESMETNVLRLVDWGLLPQTTESELYVALAGQLRHLTETFAANSTSVSGVDDLYHRVSILLRLWSGCLDAAKLIALETRSGPNTPDSRRIGFNGRVKISVSERSAARG